ncbi:MAG TPA: DUF2608 domain-containing protein [Rhabdochlamydiaceae bacterium]|nr:DUF2608 domain-containing protein [Rhabdochlamydiaceae bacterium]
MKDWMIGLVLLLPSLLRAEFLETSNIEDVFSKVDKETLVLLNMTDTISDSVLSLGSKPWRHFIHSNLQKIQNLDQAGNLHDQWTYYVATRIPVNPVQKETVTWIETLQKNETPVFCTTGRGRNVWYCTIVDQVDNFTDFQLEHIGIDFTKTKVPEELKNVDPRYFHHGIFYTDPYALGEFIDKILQETGYRPKKIVVVNDKPSELQSADQKLTEAGIDHICVLYQRTEKDRKAFNPTVALLQLESLLEDGKVALQENEAIKKAKSEKASPEELFKRLIDKYGNLK